jgi:hypothetical protein
MTVTEDDIVAPTWRCRIADPKPAFCSACLRGADADAVFIDFGMPTGRGYIREFGSNAVVADLTELYLCDACVREAIEVYGYKPQQHAKDKATVRAALAERDQLIEENYHLRQLVAEQLTGEKKSGARRN